MKAFLFLFLFVSVDLLAQNSKKASPDTLYLSKEGINRMVSNKLGSLVTGQSNAANLVNYASFDPAAERTCNRISP